VAERPNLDWFDVSKYDDEVVAIAEPGHIEDVKAYLVLGSERSLLVDSCVGLENIVPVVEQFTSGPVILVNTHGHLDHIGNNWRFQSRWVHPADVERVREGVSNERLGRFLKREAFSRTLPPGLDPATYYTPGTEPTGTVDEGDLFELGNRTLRVLHTPGHTPGCISLVDESTGSLFCGDIIHEGAMFAHYDGGWAHEYRDSVRRLAQLAPHVKNVYPGHSNYPIAPSRILDVEQAFDEIWNGREPDVHEDGLFRFYFEPFSLTLRETWRDEIPE
jgi:glyoxylase-like metal-dependent hydrolase (beta-lactamase superfamily II)